jgi:transcriptional regulator of acetoin/glycerol metabolism
VLDRGVKEHTMKIGQTVYYTRYALTQGILARKITDIRSNHVYLPSGVGYPGKDTFATIEDAQEKAQAMAKRAIKALDKKRARLEEIARDGVEGEHVSEQTMTEQRVMHVLEDEALAVVDRIAKEDRFTVPDAVRAEMIEAIRKVTARSASALVGCTETMLREAVSRHIRRQVADLRPS